MSQEYSFETGSVVGACVAATVRRENPSVSLKGSNEKCEVNPVANWEACFPLDPVPRIVRILDKTTDDGRGSTHQACVFGAESFGLASPFSPMWDDLLEDNKEILRQVIGDGHAIARYLETCPKGESASIPKSKSKSKTKSGGTKSVASSTESKPIKFTKSLFE